MFWFFFCSVYNYWPNVFFFIVGFCSNCIDDDHYAVALASDRVLIDRFFETDSLRSHNFLDKKRSEDFIFIFAARFYYQHNKDSTRESIRTGERFTLHIPFSILFIGNPNPRRRFVTFPGVITIWPKTRTIKIITNTERYTIDKRLRLGQAVQRNCVTTKN